MFTPQMLEKIPIELEKLYSQLEIEVMLDIIRRIKETASITRTADYQINRLYHLGVSKRNIKKLIKSILNLSQKEINRIYKDAIKTGYVEDEKLYKSLGKKQIQFEKNIELQQMISSIQEQTLTKLYNITNSTGFIQNRNGKNVFTPLTQYYEDTLDNTINGILNGTFDYNTAIHNAVYEMTKSGLRTVDYASGKSFRIESAARTALMTGVNQVAAKISDMNAEKLGTEDFEVSAHGTARPSHQKWQGKVYTRQQLIDICGLGEVDGLCGANCRHHYWPFIKGISVRAYTDEELQEWADKENTPKKYGDKEYTAYEATQEQRRLERVMRKERQDIRLLKEGDANEIDIAAAEAKYRITSDEYAKFSKAMELPQQRERIFNADSLKIKTNSGIKGLGANDNDTDVPPHEPPRILEKIDYNDKKQIDDTLKKYEDIIRNDKIENAIVILNTGEVYQCFGIETNVWPNVDLKGRLKDAYITHNHPKDETEYTFSVFDINMFITENLQVLRGVDHKYTYELNKNVEDNIEENLEMNFENSQHEIIKRKTQLLKIGYKRWKNE